jgi:hypothetical protein
MTRQNVLVALLFASIAAGLVLAAYEADRRHEAYVATHPMPKAPAFSGISDRLERWEKGGTPIRRDEIRLILGLIAAGAWLRLLLLGWTRKARGAERGSVGPLDLVRHRTRAPVSVLLLCACAGGALWLTLN